MLVIGSGPSGQKAAIQAAKLGKRVAVAERRDRLGGVSIHTGTIPSKTLREAVLDQLAERPLDVLDPTRMEETEQQALQQLMDRAAHVIAGGDGRGARAVPPQHGRLAARRDACFEDDAHGADRGLRRADPRRADRHRRRHEAGAARHASRSTTARSSTPTACCNLDRRVPRSMTVVGAGVIGVEYASMFGALGTKVTVVDQRDRTLSFLDGEIGEAFQYLLRRNNVTFRLREKVDGDRVGRRAARGSSSRRARRSTPRPCSTRSAARARPTGSGSSATGLEADKRGRIKVDDDFRTTVPHIFAVGDVAGGGLAATAMEQGRIAALHAFDQAVATLPALVPTGVYAIPEIGMVGATEEQLTDSSQPYVVGHRALDRARPRADDRRRDRHAEAARRPGATAACSACT